MQKTRGDRAGVMYVSSLPESPPGQDGPDHQTSTLGVPSGNDGLKGVCSVQGTKGFFKKREHAMEAQSLNHKKIDQCFPFP